ncbi:hypothetical protein IEU95_06860 [Hoyosella rhizosphaerae]|uniref:HPF/RaiA family ribosome-associated protein n=1 Tax=Hoyosella rhizosphaerae TaxID=1755582 RepID=UPI00166CCD69|nr:HPF/RaiA family ribosome-associated protein [Hoyosella rhizosphaerae]MBN4926543.1 hypothetical protein [Hoyosella rhizosphaerae]
MSDFSDRLRIIAQFSPDEADKIKDILFGRLNSRLARWSPDQVELELSVKERDTPSQRTILECWIAKMPRFVATSTEQEIDTALVEVRDDLWNQINREVTKAESARKR